MTLLAWIALAWAADQTPGDAFTVRAEALREKQRLSKATRLAQRACALGSGRGCTIAGLMLESGESGFDLEAASLHYERSCEAGYGYGCYKLAWAVLGGNGQPVDRTRGQQLLHEACERGYGLACADEASQLAETIDRDPVAARARLEWGCLEKNNASCTALAWFLLRGRGGDAEPGRARTLLEEACQRNHPSACASLADVLDLGIGQPADPEVADAWLWSACTRKSRAACQVSTGRLLDRGEFSKVYESLRRRCDLKDGFACGLYQGDPLWASCRLGSAAACLGWSKKYEGTPLGRQAHAFACGTAPSCEPTLPSPPPEVEHGPASEPWLSCFQRGMAELGAVSLRGRGPRKDPETIEIVQQLFAREGLALERLPFNAPIARRWEAQPLEFGRSHVAHVAHAPFAFSGSGALEGNVQRWEASADFQGKIVLLSDDDSVYATAWKAWLEGAAAVLVPVARLPSWLEGRHPVAGWEPPALPIPVVGIPRVHSLKQGSRVRLSVRVTEEEGTLENLVGRLPGRGELADELVVVGAHYDHIGMDEQGRVYPGADDNASGVVAVACAVDAIRTALEGQTSARTVLFALFDGEELGLLGSRALLQGDTLPPDAVSAMVNLDMVGRLEDRPLGLHGLRGGPFSSLVTEAASEVGLVVRSIAPTANGQSDYTSFLAAGVPALGLFTGLHPDYHTPYDDLTAIDLLGGARISRFTSALIPRLARAQRPSLDGCAGEGSPPLGALIDFEEPIVRCIDPSSVASAFGLLPGDRIVGINDMPTRNSHEVRWALSWSWPHTETTLVVERSGERVSLTIGR